MLKILMNALTPSPIFPFKDRNVSRLLPWIISMITYLALLLSAGTYFLYILGFGWQQSLSHQFTIEWDNYASQQTPATLVASLGAIKGLEDIHVLTTDDLAPLFKDLGSMDLKLDELSLPTMINVALTPDASVTQESLLKHLQTLGFQNLTITDHRAWQGDVKTIVLSVIFSMVVLALLTISSAILLTIFATRTSLKIHNHILEILNLVGAPPHYIAQQFGRHFLRQGLVAALVALGGFWATAFILSFLLKGHPMYTAIVPLYNLPSVIAFSLLAFIVTLLMFITTRMTVLRALARAQ